MISVKTAKPRIRRFTIVDQERFYEAITTILYVVAITIVCIGIVITWKGIYESRKHMIETLEPSTYATQTTAKSTQLVAKKPIVEKTIDFDTFEAGFISAIGLELSKEDVAILARIMEAEATGEDVKGKELIANVVINRIKDDGFPDTVKSVVFQKTGSTYQFSPIKDKRYWEVKITNDTLVALYNVLNGADDSQGALYFYDPSQTDDHWIRTRDVLFKHGVHVFAK